MNKTPVSILQELMVKKGTIPNYELIHDGGGTHVNTFVYRVSCDGLEATGTGRCKKDAKHTAAKNMLEVIAATKNYLQLPATPADSPVRTPLPEALPSSPKRAAGEPFQNAIGELKELCARNELQDPEYKLISDVGPPHARVFTYQCLVSTLREEGRATTKKQAKHDASKKMLERLLEVITDLKVRGPSNPNANLGMAREGLESMAEDAKSRYVALASTKRVNFGVKIADFHTKLKTSYNEDTLPSRTEVLTTLDSILNDLQRHEISLSPEVLSEYKTRFQESLARLNINMCTDTYDCLDHGGKVLFVTLDTAPIITEVDIGDNLVAMESSVISKVIKTFRYLME